MKHSLISTSVFTAGACVAVLALTSCSSGASAKTDAAKMTITAGVLTMGTEMPSPPTEYFKADGVTPTGVDVDLMAEVAKRLNLKLVVQSTAWAGLIPAEKANRYDVVVSAIGDFKDRQKQVDFVDYLDVRSAVVVRADGTSVADPMGLCGKSIGGTSGSVAITIAQGFSAGCKAAGKPALTINEFPSESAGLLALRSGRSDSQILDGPSAVYQAQTTEGGKAYKVALGSVGPEALYAVGVNKVNTPLRNAIAKELNAMIKDGKYKAILEKYGMDGYAIAKATVNAGGVK